MTDVDVARDVIAREAIVHGRVTLASGREADWYADLRRVTLSGHGAPLIGRAVRAVTAEWEYDAIGGLASGADPISMAALGAAAAEGVTVDAFSVRKETKSHGLQRRIEGPRVTGRRVVVVEDTSTTGSSALSAVDAVVEDGGHVVGVVAVLDRGGGQAILARGLPFRAVCTAAGLGLPGDG